MNISKNDKKNLMKSRMAIRLWCTMMLLILLVVGFMWVIQIVILEKNYVNTAIDDVQKQIEPIMEELKTVDLAYNKKLITYLSQTGDGKMILTNQNHELVALYSYGNPIDLEENKTDTVLWENIQKCDEYSSVTAGKGYNKTVYFRNRIQAYEVGIPVKYYGEEAYIILYHSFSELYTVLDMNRNQLILSTVILTVLAAIIAIGMSRRFTHPIKVIKETVDSLTEGKLTATTGIKLQDELGQLSSSVEKLGKELQRVDVLRKELIANISHELRSPLALISGYAEMVRDLNWRDDLLREEDLTLIINEAHRMSEMVNDILDYSQLQSGYLQLKKECYNLYEVVESEVIHCEGSAMENKIHIKLDSVKSDIQVSIDALKISQVMRNLIYNAINHTADGDEIEVRIEEGETEYKVSVVNPGVPIPEEDRAVIWLRYQRSQHQGGRKQGTGIGLSIVSTILTEHDMAYGVDCSDGKTIFWFSYKKNE